MRYSKINDYLLLKDKFEKGKAWIEKGYAKKQDKLVFVKKVAEPMDAAWAALTDEEKQKAEEHDEEHDKEIIRIGKELFT